MKKWEITLLAAFIITVLISFCGFADRCDQISDKVLRLHILANSDSDEDQELKLKVRDRLLEESKDMLPTGCTREQAGEIVSENLNRLTIAAGDEINRQGYDYPVSVEYGKHFFNTREYDDVTMPPGEYDALRVLIGDGEGKNWWCVMFPQMCLPAAQPQDGLVQDSGRLEEQLDDDQMEIVKGKVKYELRFKTLEFLEELNDYLVKK